MAINVAIHMAIYAVIRPCGPNGQHRHEQQKDQSDALHKVIIPILLCSCNGIFANAQANPLLPLDLCGPMHQ